MNKNKHLDGTGKGEFLYDYKYDTLTFKIKDADYKRSIEIQNFVIDIDTRNFVTGIRIFDVSKVSGMNKLVFCNLKHGEFKASVRDNVITVRLKFVGRIHNKLISIFKSEENYVQQVTAPAGSKNPLMDSDVVVPEILAA
jgi:hypothetical protein